MDRSSSDRSEVAKRVSKGLNSGHQTGQTPGEGGGPRAVRQHISLLSSAWSVWLQVAAPAVAGEWSRCPAQQLSAGHRGGWTASSTWICGPTLPCSGSRDPLPTGILGRRNGTRALRQSLQQLGQHLTVKPPGGAIRWGDCVCSTRPGLRQRLTDSLECCLGGGK